MRRYYKWICVAGLLASSHLGAEGNTGAAAWMQQGAGARAQGLGCAYLAVADDVTAGYWNPAGLTRMGIHGTEFAAMQNWSAEDQEYDYVGLAQHFEDSVDLYAGFQRNAVFGIRSYDSSGQRGEDLSDQGLAFSLGLAAAPEYRFRWGLVLKGLREDLGPDRAWGWGADLGFIFQPELASDFLVAAVLKDLSGGLAWDTGRTDWTSPRLGLGLSQKFAQKHWLLSAEAELPIVSDPRAILRLGTEYAVDEHWALRAGADDMEPSAGASLNWGFYEFDYAFTWRPQSDTVFVNQASLLLKF